MKYKIEKDQTKTDNKEKKRELKRLKEDEKLQKKQAKEAAIEERKNQRNLDKAVEAISSIDDMAYSFSLLGIQYNSSFNDLLNLNFGLSLIEAMDLQSQRLDSFAAADDIPDLPLFYTLVQYLKIAEEKVGNKNYGLLKTVKQVCEMQCANKGSVGCG
ncbi:MAG: hypothetical protein LBI53_08420 [Candidatus Peribacteria bacterium]|jgi:hypothetical protein|nr:hypothetical protein [Candidatus Peribacteria bacterium]